MQLKFRRLSSAQMTSRCELLQEATVMCVVTRLCVMMHVFLLDINFALVVDFAKLHPCRLLFRQD